MTTNDECGLVLSGLDGSNPLGFLAAIGVLRILADSNNTARMAWRVTRGGWRPSLTGVGRDQDELCSVLHSSLKEAPTAIFDIGKAQEGQKEANKFPFAADRFASALKEAVSRAHAEDRREVDLLAAIGTELHPNEKGAFQCTSFKMVRSGDSKGQGMLFYAKALRTSLDGRMLERALFNAWDYEDEGYSLRWDPIEDQRYALRWRDPSPSKSDPTYRQGTMTAANCLAVEALRCLPVMLRGRQAHTTGFRNLQRRTAFVWPIWTATLALDTVRSVLSLPDLDRTPLDRTALAAQGVQEVYGVQLVRPNKYYSNFAPALPIT